jgi:chromosome segregation ATPase
MSTVLSNYSSFFYFKATRIAYGAKRYRVVTLNGDLIETSGAMAGGGREKMHGKMGTQVKNIRCPFVTVNV